MIDVIGTVRSAVRNKSPHKWRCTRRHRWSRCWAVQLAANATTVPVATTCRRQLRGRGSDGWRRPGRIQIRQHCACDGDESQDDYRDSSRHWREQPVWFFPADNPRCVTDSDWQGWRSANTYVLAVNEHSLWGDPFCVQSVHRLHSGAGDRTKSTTVPRGSGTVVQEFSSQWTDESNQAKSSAAIMRETHVTEVIKVTDELFAFVDQPKRSSAQCHVRCDDDRRWPGEHDWTTRYSLQLQRKAEPMKAVQYEMKSRDAKDSSSSSRNSVSPWIEEMESGCERSELWSCCPTSRPSPQCSGFGRGGVLEDRQHDTTISDQQTRSPQSTTTPPATTQARAGALVPPPPCLGGGATRVGRGQYPHYTRADQKTKHEKNTHTKTKQKNEKDPGTKKMKKKKQVRMSDSSAPQLHDRLTCPRAQRHAQTASTHARASALVFSSSCLNESTSRVGPGQYPQYTRAPSEKGMWVAHHQHNSWAQRTSHERWKSRKNSKKQHLKNKNRENEDMKKWKNWKQSTPQNKIAKIKTWKNEKKTAKWSQK